MSSIPVEITPNNDGDRDVWPFSNSGIVKMNVQIFEKATGKKVFEREGSSFDWDGKNNSGDDLKDGVYFYYVTGIGIKDRKSYEKKGYIQIKR